VKIHIKNQEISHKKNVKKLVEFSGVILIGRRIAGPGTQLCSGWRRFPVGGVFRLVETPTGSSRD